MRILTEAPSFDNIKSSSIETPLPNGTKKKHWYIQGIFAQADVNNRNKRRYPRDILFEQVVKYTDVYINKNRAVGECGHPESVTINPDRVSHIITEMTTEGNDVYGKAKILDRMPMGNLVAILLDEGVQLGVSTRGVGSVDSESLDGIEIVKEDFFLAAVDIVHDPSAPKSFVHGIMENRKFLIKENVELDNDRYKKIIRATNKRNQEEIFLRLFEDYCKRIGE